MTSIALIATYQKGFTVTHEFTSFAAANRNLQL